jgi:hypothetical protein
LVGPAAINPDIIHQRGTYIATPVSVTTDAVIGVIKPLAFGYGIRIILILRHVKRGILAACTHLIHSDSIGKL